MAPRKPRKPTKPNYWIIKYPMKIEDQEKQQEMVIFTSTDKYSKYLKKLLGERDDLDFVSIASFESFQAAIEVASKIDGKLLSEAEIDL